MIFVIDVESLLPAGELMKFSPTVLRAVAEQVAAIARAKWISLANDKLHKTSQDYVRGIQPVKTEGDVLSITLVGQLPNMIEDGFSAFDLRDTLLGPNVPVVGPGGGRGKREKKDGTGFYRSLMFRQGGPDTTGRNAQKVTDAYAQYLGKETAEAIGRAAWREMKKLAPSTSQPGGGTSWGGRLAEGAVTDQRGRSHRLVSGATGFDIAGSSKGGEMLAPGTLIRHGGPEHKTDLFAGAVKMQQPKGQGHSTFYGTFRTISTAVTEGWIHPGFAGAHLAPQASEFAAKQAPIILDKIFEQMP